MKTKAVWSWRWWLRNTDRKPLRFQSVPNYTGGSPAYAAEEAVASWMTAGRGWAHWTRAYVQVRLNLTGEIWDVVVDIEPKYTATKIKEFLNPEKVP